VTSPDLVTGEPSLQASSAKDLRQALVDASWLKYVSRLPDAKTADGPMYHFRVSLDDDAMTAVLLKLQELRQGSTTPDDQPPPRWRCPPGTIPSAKSSSQEGRSPAPLGIHG